MLRKLFNLVRYAFSVEIMDSFPGRQLHITFSTHYGGLETDVYIARWRGIQIYCEHLSFYAGRWLAKVQEPVETVASKGVDCSWSNVLGPIQWKAHEHCGTYAETLTVFGKRIAQRVA